MKVLNVGGGNKRIALPPNFDGWEHVLLDIDANLQPDVVCDARKLHVCLDPGEYEAVYSSHNLEHYHPHEVPKVLSGMLHVLKRGGFCYIRVPNLEFVLRKAGMGGMQLHDVLYESAVGPITVLDVIYGHAGMIERGGNEFMSHRTGFSPNSLRAAVELAGFERVEIHVFDAIHEVVAIGYKLSEGA